jgi:arginine-tRNA-protein transferase
MKYYLENQLIAVGVVDLLTESVSSVYFFYDPSYKKYSLGVFGVLSEI